MIAIKILAVIGALFIGTVLTAWVDSIGEKK